MDTISGIYVQDYNQWTTEASKYKNTTSAKLLHHNHHRAYNAQAHKNYHGDTISVVKHIIYLVCSVT